MPSTVSTRTSEAASPWMVAVHRRWCTTLAAGLLRPRIAETVSPGHCERPIAAIREGRAQPTSAEAEAPQGGSP
ncbi:MAG: hypothetical protein H6710_08195 [Myxococcales bacterium]|nr:hypothetical protein [Myxococcales bacterium]